MPCLSLALAMSDEECREAEIKRLFFSKSLASFSCRFFHFRTPLSWRLLRPNETEVLAYLVPNGKSATAEEKPGNSTAKKQ